VTVGPTTDEQTDRQTDGQSVMLIICPMLCKNCGFALSFALRLQMLVVVSVSMSHLWSQTDVYQSVAHLGVVGYIHPVLVLDLKLTGYTAKRSYFCAST